MFKFRVAAKAALLLVLMALFVLSNATASEVDNCCFVDRQCLTNEDWTNGYYAFQNNQCGAASQQQNQQVRQDQTPEQSNNCCFSGWQCSSDDDWTIGYFAFQHDHCAMQSHWEEQWRKRQSAGTAARNSNQPQQPEQTRRGNRNRRPQPEQEPPQVQRETEDWHRCGFPCEPLDPNGPRVGITLDLTKTKPHWVEADDGAPVLVGPEVRD